MLYLRQFGVTLKRIEESDIELVRKWRNSSIIKSQMEYKKHITSEMQRKWFASINNKLNYYFLIQFDSKNVGVINCKNLDFKTNSSEGGIFVVNTNNEFIGTFASLCLLNACFKKINCFEKSIIKIKSSNKKAIFFNRSLGYKKISRENNINFQYFTLSRSDYLLKSQRLNDIASKMSNDFNEVEIFGDKSPLNIDQINRLL